MIDRDALSHRLDELIAAHDVPGASLAVLSDGGLVEVCAGVANCNTGVEVTTDTLFQIGSITKVYTATLVLQLVDEASVDLDAPVRTYLPELSLADAEAGATITPRHLLSHTAGLEGDYFGEFGGGDDAIRRYVASLGDLGQLHRPGELFSYCNTGWVVLGRLVEVVTGMPYAMALQERLLQPAGLRATTIRTEDAILRRIAVGHLPHPDTGRPSVAPIWCLDPASAPAGALTCATAADVVAFARLHLDDGRAADGTQVLSPASVKAMTEVQVRLAPHGPRDAFGLGWALTDAGATRLVGHDGGTLGQLAFLQMAPDRRFVAVLLTNGMNGLEVSRTLLHELFDAELGVELPGPPEPGDGTPQNVERYAGTYERLGVQVVVRARDEQLFADVNYSGVLAVTSSPLRDVALPYVDGDAFLLPSPGRTVPAVLTDIVNGKPTWLHIGGRAHRRAG